MRYSLRNMDISIQLLIMFATSVMADQARYGPPPVKEEFRLQNMVYTLYSVRVTWDEAFAMCRDQEQNLAVPDTSGKANFLSHALANAWMSFEDMWIGGVREGDVWSWLNGDKETRIPDVMTQESNFTFRYPPWVKGQYPKRWNRDCLAIDRDDHYNPMFVDLKCDRPRSFVCQKQGEHVGEPELVKTLQLGSIRFYMYRGRLSWADSLAFCRRKSQILASVRSRSVAQKLARAMLQSRPVFEDAWIGARHKGDQWTWVEDSSDLEEGHNWPPWLHKRGDQQDCIRLDRHLVQSPTFVPVRCHWRRNIICQDKVERSSTKPPTETVLYNCHNYTAVTEKMPWEKARRYCDSLGLQLLELKGIDEMNFIMKTMADLKQEMDHAWVAGQIRDDEWKWVYSGRPVKISVSWLDYAARGQSQDCLNLDRQNHWTPVLYGMPCNQEQRFFCVHPDETKQCVDQQFVEGRVKHQMSYGDAEKTCNDQFGRLITFSVKLDNGRKSSGSEHSIKSLAPGKYFTGMKTNRFLQLCHHDSAKAYVKYTSKDTKVEPPYNGDCVQLTVNDQHQGHYTSVDCNAKYSNLTLLCSYTCERLGRPYNRDNSSWSCTYETGLWNKERVIGKKCELECGESQATFGSRKQTCTTEGWAGAHGKDMPQCLVGKNAFNFMPNVLNGTRNVIFLMDPTIFSRPKEYLIFKYFVYAVISNMCSTNGVDQSGYAALTSSKKNEIEVKWHRLAEICGNTSASSIWPNVSATRSRRLYREMFQAAYHAVMDHDELNINNTILFFMMDGPNEGQDYSRDLKSLQAEVDGVVGIGLKGYNEDEMAEVATTKHGALSMVAFQQWDTLIEAIQQLVKPGICDQRLNEVLLQLTKLKLGGGSTISIQAKEKK